MPVTKPRDANDILYEAYYEIFKDSQRPINTFYYHVKRSPGLRHIIEEAYVSSTARRVPKRRFGKKRSRSGRSIRKRRLKS